MKVFLFSCFSLDSFVFFIVFAFELTGMLYLRDCSELVFWSSVSFCGFSLFLDRPPCSSSVSSRICVFCLRRANSCSIFKKSAFTYEGNS